MTENAQTKTSRFAKLRVVAVLGLLVLVLLFAPLGQGVGLSAGQGPVSASDPAAAVNDLAAAEVEQLAARD